MRRMVLFTTRTGGAPAVMVRALLRMVAGRSDVRLAAVCVTDPEPAPRPAWMKRVRAWRSPERWAARPCDLERLSRCHGFRLIEPPGFRLDDPDFIRLLREELRPDLGLSVYARQHFGPELLESLPHAVNYHNGFLPGYRGMKATAWSVYQRERETGCAFHRMTPGWDEGPVLWQGGIPVDAGSSVRELDDRKAVMASRHLADVLERAWVGDPGRVQEGPGQRFTQKQSAAMKRIVDPESWSAEELLLRQRAFGRLTLCWRNRAEAVVKLRATPDPRGGRSGFRTVDGQWMEVVPASGTFRF